MPFDPVRDAAGAGAPSSSASSSFFPAAPQTQPQLNSSPSSIPQSIRSTSPSSPLFTPLTTIPPSPSIKKGSLANILNDDPSLDPSLRSPEARISSSYLDSSSSPVFEFPPRSGSSGLGSHTFFPSPSMGPTLTQTASPVFGSASRPSSSGRSLPPASVSASASSRPGSSRPSSLPRPTIPQTQAFSLSSPPPPKQPPPPAVPVPAPEPVGTLYLPTKLQPNAPALLPLSQRDVDLFTRSRNWLRKNVDRASLPPPHPVPLPPLASSIPSSTSNNNNNNVSVKSASPAPATLTAFSDETGIGYYLPSSSSPKASAETLPSHPAKNNNSNNNTGYYSPSGPTTGAYSPSRPNSKRAREDDEMSSPATKRRAPSAPGEDIIAVAGHYNARKEVGRTARKDSPIIALKNFNNWIKSVLIQKYGRRNSSTSVPARGSFVRVLDIGCGKGGDLNKWAKNGVGEYVGLDIAEVSVRQAEERFREMGRRGRMNAYFQAMDCYRESIRARLPPGVFASPFQTVTMQFCMHYAFYSEESVRQMLDNVSTNLEPGGTFIGTIPNAEHILRHTDPATLSFGNPVFRITFPTAPPPPPAPKDADQSGAFGHKYFFYLQDAVGEDEAGVPEYLVHWPNFVRIAAEYGLVEEYRKDFTDMLLEEKQHPVYGPLLQRMKVIDADGQSDMDEEQWDAASIYLAFAFRKR